MIGEPVVKRKVFLLYEQAYKEDNKKSDIEFVKRAIKLQLDSDKISNLTGWAIEDIEKIKSHLK